MKKSDLKALLNEINEDHHRFITRNFDIDLRDYDKGFFGEHSFAEITEKEERLLYMAIRSYNVANQKHTQLESSVQHFLGALDELKTAVSKD